MGGSCVAGGCCSFLSVLVFLFVPPALRLIPRITPEVTRRMEIGMIISGAVSFIFGVFYLLIGEFFSVGGP